MELNATQWRLISKQLSKSRGGGRPRVNDRRLFDGLLFILRTGSSWHQVPAKYGSRATLHRRFQEWSENGSFLRAWKTLMTLMDRKGKLDWSEGFVDGSFVPAKKGGPELTKRAAVKVHAGLLSRRAAGAYQSV